MEKLTLNPDGKSGFDKLGMTQEESSAFDKKMTEDLLPKHAKLFVEAAMMKDDSQEQQKKAHEIENLLFQDINENFSQKELVFMASRFMALTIKDTVSENPMIQLMAMLSAGK